MKKIIPPIIQKRKVNQVGKWIFKPLKSTVVVCVCGNKYIVTRKNQTECVNCSYGKRAR